MKKRMKWILIGVLVLAVAAGAFWSFAGRPAAAPEHLTVTEEPFVQVVSATGRLVPARSVQIQSQVTARLLDLPFAEGDSVNNGTVLALLDDGDSRQRLAESRYALTLAQARTRALSELSVPLTREELHQLELNREQLDMTRQRQEILHEQGALPLEPLEETRNQLSVLDSRIRSAETALASRMSGGAEAAEAAALVAQARNNVETLERELEKYTLTAPFDGVVLERLVEPGELMQPGTVLMVLAAVEPFVAEVDLDERSMGLLQVGQPARLWPEAYPSREVAARVLSIAPRVNAETGTVRVRLALEEPADFLIQDLTIQTEIEVRSLESALLLPAAFLWQQDPAAVLVADQGTVEERRLDRVEWVSLNQLLVLDGLASGDVVLDPEAGLTPGDAVALLPDPESGGGQ